MPPLRTYNVFISHAWQYSDDYNRVVDFLNGAANFAWHNLSVPRHDPVSNEELEYALRGQMRPADVFLIVAGMYAAHSDWIGFEIDFAQRIGRPIIGITPWGGERIPVKVQDAAVEMVGWSTVGIVGAIRNHALPSGS